MNLNRLYIYLLCNKQHKNINLKISIFAIYGYTGKSKRNTIQNTGII